MSMEIHYGRCSHGVNMSKRKKTAQQMRTPAELVEIRFGGSRLVSRLIGRNEQQLSLWKRRGGHIPVMGIGGENMHHKLLALAKEMNVKLTEIELTHGGMA